MRERVVDQRYEPPKRRRSIIRIAWFFVLIVVAIALSFHYFRSSPAGTSNLKLDWPKTGEAAIGIVGQGVSGTNGAQTARPTASTAKLITALTVLKKYPLQPGQSGPSITLTLNDVKIYSQYLSEDGSSTRVLVGAQLSEYQMLEAMLIPSANNMADSLAIWAFGSLANYKVAATQTVKSLGLDSTKIGSDASGLSPDTVSTAHNLVLVGEAAMQNPVIAQIVGTSQTTLPVAGTITNNNTLLGQDGIVGVKTGNSDEAGGVFVFAAKYSTANGQKLTIVGAVQGLPNLPTALQVAKPLLHSAEQNISQGKLAAAN
jgi:D-alanyl-D-alanine carboxypeptidase (penicillin-binding protein 5/6)